jgi:(1->4)-alpha-D-glucan 1-alpha-D-glucosylmutase
MSLSKEWKDTTVVLPEGTWTNVLTDDLIGSGAVRIAELLSAFPVALLTREED